MTELLAAISHWNPASIASVQKMADKATNKSLIVYAILRKNDMQFFMTDTEPPFGAETVIRSRKGFKTAQIIRIK